MFPFSNNHNQRCPVGSKASKVMDKLSAFFILIIFFFLTRHTNSQGTTAPTNASTPNTTTANVTTPEPTIAPDPDVETPEPPQLIDWSSAVLNSDVFGNGSNYTNVTREHDGLNLTDPKAGSLGGTVLHFDGWLRYSQRIFRKFDRLPSDALSFHGVKCDFKIWKALSPVATIAFPVHADDSVNAKQSTIRDMHIQMFRTQPDNPKPECMNQDVPDLPCPITYVTMWKSVLNGETEISEDEVKMHEQKAKGRSLEAAMCYTSGNELLECDPTTQKCVCPASGNLAKLRMTRMKQSKTSTKTACFAMDCGYCLMKSKTTCGHYGICREAAITRKWPFTHLNGSCRDSLLNLNSQLAAAEVDADMGYVIHAYRSQLIISVFILLVHKLYLC